MIVMTPVKAWTSHHLTHVSLTGYSDGSVLRSQQTYIKSDQIKYTLRQSSSLYRHLLVPCSVGDFIGDSIRLCIRLQYPRSMKEYVNTAKCVKGNLLPKGPDLSACVLQQLQQGPCCVSPACGTT